MTVDRRRNLAMLGIMVTLAAGVWFNNELGLSAIARQTHDGLCALHDDVQRRHAASVKFLKENPRGLVSPKTGAVILTPAQIQQSIKNQESTLKALDESGLVC